MSEEKQQFTEEQLFEAMFMQLVLAMGSETMWLLGKVAHPVTGKIERNMVGAKHSIDMLRMLRSKTKGNLGANEEQLLEKTISELQMNYLDEMKKGPDAAAGTDQGETGNGKPSSAEAAEGGQETAGKETENRKPETEESEGKPKAKKKAAKKKSAKKKK